MATKSNCILLSLFFNFISDESKAMSAPDTLMTSICKSHFEFSSISLSSK